MVKGCPLQPFTLECICHQYRNSLLFASCTTHCSPSCRFVPVMALHARIVHLCVLMLSSLRPCTALLA